MKLKFMPDSRQDDLIKAAKDCLGLMGVGADPNDALYKVAEDAGLNDNEVVLVSHAVNNGALLNHLQTAEDDEKGDSFPLTNAKVVIDRREKELRAPVSQQHKDEQPDALDIKDEVTKEASFIERTTYRKVASVSVDDIRAELGIPRSSALPSAELDHPLAREQQLKHAYDTAQAEYTKAYQDVVGLIDSLSERLSYATAPKFASFEEASLALGVDSGLLDLIYRSGALDSIGQARLTKSASDGTVIVSPELGALLEDCVRADTILKQASAAHERAEAAKVEFDKVCVKAANTEKSDGWFDGGVKTDIDFSPDKQLSSLERVGSAPMDLLGGGAVESSTKLMRGVTGDVDPSSKSDGATQSDLGSRFNQERENFDTAGTISRLMNDEFIKGHSIAEVVEAYNDAMNVNPQFGDTELKAYMRQHLASQGSMPLDLMIRARAKGGDKP